jgi:hypothetical protein
VQHRGDVSAGYERRLTTSGGTVVIAASSSRSMVDRWKRSFECSSASSRSSRLCGADLYQLELAG